MSKYKIGNALPIIFFLLAVSAVVFFMGEARATKPKPPENPGQQQSQGQDQNQGQDQKQQQTSKSQSHSESVADSSANNEGNNLSVNSHYESGPAEVVLVPHNNTANCQRVYGLGGGNTSGNIVLGFPFRDRSCDLEAAADDAFAQGNTALGWVFKCKQKNIKREFGGKEWRTKGEQLCLSMVSSIVDLKSRITLLETQRKTLLDERKFDYDRCNEEKNRILDGCLRK